MTLSMEYSREELTEMLDKMSAASSTFYTLAVRIGNHQFIEFTGLMNEYIKICRHNLDAGRDFVTGRLEVKGYELAYIAEKLDCIFGEVLTDPKMRKVFVDELFGMRAPVVR